LPEFRFEALWCLTNIASGTSDNTQSIVIKGGVEKIISLIDSNIQEIQEQAIWAVGNIAGDSLKVRDRVIDKKGLEKILKVFATAERNTLIKHSAWAISNFCRSKPAPAYEHLKPAIDLIIRSIYKLDQDYEFLVDACWVLSYITEHHKKSVKKILDTNIMPKLLSFLNYPVVYIQLPILRIVGNIVTGNANQTQMIVDAGVLKYLKNTLLHEKRSIRRETCWIISNIAAGTQQQIEAIILADFIPLLEQVIKNDEPDVYCY
jgi:importin subunit alpha-1